MVVGCDDLGETLAFFVDQIGFRVDVISPADDPRVAVISGHGVRLRLERDGAGDAAREPAVVRLVCHDPHTWPHRGNCRTAGAS